ncbi:preprotein translocase subunit SecD [Bordetella genomosp. 9]|uniref:SecDF P1 head subdomain-containing protein n=1 Tax=Bordetella genomosp. 9 TaxID=1416803 RepID=UPI000A28EB4B|nr:preprotein translocase subunit SecD [Bordetella genomosp. 9]ARP92015.1 preprotein translocase subunit SecD [Bordetella genomosp. 9]
MHIKLRTLAPAMLMATVVLAGCQTAGNKAAKGTAGEQGAATPPAATAPSAPQAAPAAASVGFYVAQTEPGTGLTQVKLTDTTVYVQPNPVLTRADLTEAAALVDRQGNNFVGLRFSPEGARKLSQISAQNVGKLLVLVINGQLVAAPRIAEPLNRGVLAFSVDTAQTANEIAARVRGDAPAASTAPAQSGTAAPGATPGAPAPAR